MSLKDKRRARKKEQIAAYTENAKKVHELLKELTPDMFINFKDLEETLVEDGEIVYRSDDFRMEHCDPMLKAFKAMELAAEDNLNKVDNRVHFKVGLDVSDGICVVMVTPTPSYILSEIKNRLRQRGITLRLCREDMGECEVHLSITGEKMMSNLLERRKQEKARQASGRTDTQNKVLALLKNVEASMFVDIEGTENTLVKHGRLTCHAQAFSLRPDFETFRQLGKIHVSRIDEVKRIDPRFIIYLDVIHGNSISMVVPTAEYLKNEIRTYLHGRGINMRVDSPEEDVCYIYLSIEGDY